MAKLAVLMVTAFVDMVGLLMIVPLLPFYALNLGGNGTVVGLLVSAFSVAQLLSSPLWGRVSDRYGRRPALMIGLGASAIAYVIFGFADSLWLLFVSRIVQGAGGGTVGVIQAYVSDSTEPENRAKALGWLSAATSLGVTIGPVLGSLSRAWGPAAPGLFAAGLCVLNMGFAWRYLQESRTWSAEDAHVPATRPRQVVWHVLSRGGEPAPRLIWIYAIAMGAFQAMNAVLALFLAEVHGITERNIGFFYMFIGGMGVLARAGLLGPLVTRLGEPRLSRIGTVTLAAGLAAMPFTGNHVTLALVVMLVPLGTAFTFPCVTSLLSRVILPRERGVFMGVQQSFGGVARVIGPVWAGWAYEHLGTGVPFWSSAALVLGTLVLGIGMEEYTRRRPEPAVLPA